MAAAARFTPSRHQIGKIEAARRWLCTYLADGNARNASDVIVAGLAAGHKKRTLQLAAQQVCTIAPSRSSQGGITAWAWQLRDRSNAIAPSQVSV